MYNYDKNVLYEKRNYKIVMEDTYHLNSNRLPINIMNNNTLINEEHVCKLVLYMEIPGVK